MKAARKDSVPQRFEDLKKIFKTGALEPLYLLYGDEPFFLTELQRFAEKVVVDEALKDFNCDIFYGDEVAADEAILRCLAPPMMAKRRLVIVRRFHKMAGNDRWIAYEKHPNPRAVVLLICEQRPDMRRKVYKALKARRVAHEFEPLKKNQRLSFIRQRVKAAGRSIEADALDLLGEYLGASLSVVATETDKLLTYAGQRTQLTVDDVAVAIGQSIDVKPWELQEAVLDGDPFRSEALASKLIESSQDKRGTAIGTVISLGKFFSQAWKAYSLEHRRRMPRSKVAEALDSRPFVARKYIRAARHFGPDGLQQVFSALLAADCELKGFRMRDPELVMTLLLRRVHEAAGAGSRHAARAR